MNILNRISERVPPYVALIPVCVGVFVAADDQTVIVTVLPQIMLDMEVPVTELDHASWAITGYLLGYLVGMPLIGRVSDVWGHRRLYILSVVAFMIGSVAVALTQSLNWMIAARVFQAIGAGALVPIAIAIVGDLFPRGKRALPLGIVGAAAEAGGVIGPLWGGIIIRYLDWRWVFWINIPLAVLTIALILLMLRPSPRFPASVDVVGGALVAGALTCTTLAFSRIGSFDWFGGAFVAGAVLSLILFIMRQRSTTDPLLPPAMFRVLAFVTSNITHLLVGAALIIGMVTVPLMANTVMGRTPLEGGLWLMRMTAGIPFGAMLGGLMAQRFDLRVPAATGLVFAAVGYWLVSGWGLDIGEPDLTLHLLVVGFGFGLLIVPIALAGTETVGEDIRATAASMVTALTHSWDDIWSRGSHSLGCRPLRCPRRRHPAALRRGHTNQSGSPGPDRPIHRPDQRRRHNPVPGVLRHRRGGMSLGGRARPPDDREQDRREAISYPNRRRGCFTRSARGRLIPSAH